jgi:hypothetical protein
MSPKIETKQGQKRWETKGDKKTNRKRTKGKKTLSHKKTKRGKPTTILAIFMEMKPHALK